MNNLELIEKLIFGFAGLCTVGFLLLATGCSGVEVGGKLGIYRVDERQESSSMTRHNSVPLKCYFVQCEQPTLDLK